MTTKAPPFRSGAEFEQALALLRKRGVKAAELLRELEQNRNQAARWSRERAPRMVALAISAVLFDLSPWRPSE